MLEPLWGLKTQAMFDVWSFEHFLMGMSLGTGVIFYNGKNLYRYIKELPEKILHPKKFHILKYKYDIMFILFLAYMWETVEHYLETGLGGKWLEYWFYGVEYPVNRLIADPVILILGYLFVKKYPKFCWPARIISLAWIITNLFIFPHSMYLHEIF